MHKMIDLILSVVLYMLDTCSHFLREENRLRLSDQNAGKNIWTLVEISDNNRALVKPRRRWEDNIKIGSKVSSLW